MRLFLCSFLVLLTAIAGAQTNSPAPAALDLFNGRNLDGLQPWLENSSVDPATIWSVENGILRCTGTTRGYLRTQMPYADYKLTLDWRWPKGGGNSGVLIHIVNRDEIWPKSIEAQLAAGRAGDMVTFHDARSKEESVSRNPRGVSTGRLPRPGDSAEKPIGEWNTFEIVAAGDTLTLTVNGVKVNQMSGIVPGAGMIGFQSEGAAIDFRNIKLTFLPPAKDVNAVPR